MNIKPVSAIDELSMCLPHLRDTNKFERKRRKREFNDFRGKRIRLAKAIKRGIENGYDDETIAMYALSRVDIPEASFPSLGDHIAVISDKYGGHERLAERIDYELNTLSTGMKNEIVPIVLSVAAVALALVSCMRWGVITGTLFGITSAVVFFIVFITVAIPFYMSHTNALTGIVARTVGPPDRNIDESEEMVRSWMR